MEHQAIRLFDNLISEGEKLLTYETLSEYLSVPISTLQDWVYQNKIPFGKAGRRVRFIPSEIREWLKKRSQQ